jgi:hypothetical protein
VPASAAEHGARGNGHDWKSAPLSTGISIPESRAEDRSLNSRERSLAFLRWNPHGRAVLSRTDCSAYRKTNELAYHASSYRWSKSTTIRTSPR